MTLEVKQWPWDAPPSDALEHRGELTLRLTHAETQQLADAAQRRGMYVWDFVRSVALIEAARDILAPTPPTRHVDDADVSDAKRAALTQLHGQRPPDTITVQLDSRDILHAVYRGATLKRW